MALLQATRSADLLFSSSSLENPRLNWRHVEIGMFYPAESLQTTSVQQKSLLPCIVLQTGAPSCHIEMTPLVLDVLSTFLSEAFVYLLAASGGHGDC